MKKIIILFLIIILGGGTLYFVFTRDTAEKPTQNGTTFPLSGYTISSSPDGNKLLIHTPLEDAIEANNFLKNAIPEGGGNYELARSPEYSIGYFEKDGSFQIAILQRPASAARGKAELKFLEILGIGINDACKLNVSLGVPFFVDPALGQNYGLSFCQDGISF